MTKPIIRFLITDISDDATQPTKVPCTGYNFYKVNRTGNLEITTGQVVTAYIRPMNKNMAITILSQHKATAEQLLPQITESLQMSTGVKPVILAAINQDKNTMGPIDKTKELFQNMAENQLAHTCYYDSETTAIVNLCDTLAREDIETTMSNAGVVPSLIAKIPVINNFLTSEEWKKVFEANTELKDFCHHITTTKQSYEAKYSLNTGQPMINKEISDVMLGIISNYEENNTEHNNQDQRLETMKNLEKEINIQMPSTPFSLGAGDPDAAEDQCNCTIS